MNIPTLPKSALLAFLAAACALPAAAPAGFHFWTPAELKAYSKSLSPKIDAQKVATASLGSHGNYLFMIAHREGPGQAEYHEKQADIFVVETGTGTLVYGGKMVDAKTTAPGEMRGPSIAGGLEKPLAPGDIVAIPPNTPHQVKLAAGHEITYFVVKVTQ